MLPFPPTLMLSLALAAAPARPPVVALLPVRAPTVPAAQLGALMEARASELIEQTGAFSEVHSRQVWAMTEQEGLTPAGLGETAAAQAARALLGADRVVSVAVAARPGGFHVEGAVVQASGATPFSMDVPQDWPRALRLGSEAIARAALGGDAKLAEQPSAQPESSSGPALQALGACWDAVLHQPLGPEARTALTPEQLAAAQASCAAALKADGTLAFGRAALAVLQAVGRQDDEAKATLDALGEADTLEPAVLARFWLTCRAQSYAAGAEWLGKVVEAHPGTLLLRAYLAEALGTMNEHERAEAAWKAYLARAPASPWAQGRLSREQARQGRHEAALDTAKSALAAAPASREARLQVASRQVDVGQVKDAIATLTPLAAQAGTPPEVLLRLGWAHWLAGEVDAAEGLYRKATERAQGAWAWRVKGRAAYNLALIEAKRGRAAEAKAQWKRAQAEGFEVANPEPQLAAVLAGEVSAPAPAGKALPTVAAAAVPNGALYLSVDPSSESSPAPKEIVAQCEALLRQHLVALGARFAPPGQDKKATLAQVRARRLKSFAVQLQIRPGDGPEELGVDLMVMTYPEKALKGSWRVKAAGAELERLADVIVPKVVEDAAGDLGWKD